MTNLASVNTNLFVVLRAVLEQRSVSRAAKALNLSQPAVSNHLAKLRQLLGDELLVRAGSQMRLTPRAEALLPTLQQGLQALQAILHEPEAFDPSACTHRFRIAMADIAETTLLVPLLARLRREAPRCSLQVFSAGVFDVSQRLVDGELDAVLTIVDQQELGAGLYLDRLYKSRFSLIARRDHPSVTPVMTLEGYAALEHVIVTATDGATGVLDQTLAAEGLQRRIAVRLPRSVLVPPLVAHSDLVAAVDTPALMPYGGALPLMSFSVEGLELPRGDVAMVWHERTHKSPAQRWLRAVLRDEARGVSP